MTDIKAALAKWTPSEIRAALVALATFLGAAAATGLIGDPWDKWAACLLTALTGVGIHQSARAATARKAAGQGDTPPAGQ